MCKQADTYVYTQTHVTNIYSYTTKYAHTRDNIAIHTHAHLHTHTCTETDRHITTHI